MEKKLPPPMSPFDELVVPPALQTMKLLLPYTPPARQQIFGTFIKFIEFRETLAFFRNRPAQVSSQALHRTPGTSPVEILKEIQPYLPAKDAETLGNFINAMEMMEMMQMYQEFSDSSDSTESTDANNGFSPADLLMGMLSPQQQEMFQTYSAMFSDTEQQNENFQKGDDIDRGLDESSGHAEH